MKRVIELKHVGPREHVQQLLEELIARLEEKLQHYRQDSVSLHVLFDENGSHKLYRIAVTCHVPAHTLVAHGESRDAGGTIRKAFEEIDHQLGKLKAVIRHEHELRRMRKIAKTPGKEKAVAPSTEASLAGEPEE